MQAKKEEIAPSRIVILGAGGFIGNYLTKRCMENKIPVLPLTSNQVDLTTPNSISFLTDTFRETDTLIFLSALTPDRGKGVDTFIKNNLMGYHVTEALKKSRVAHVIYLSSDAVYSFDDHLIDEKTPAIPTDLYGVMHRSREIMLASLDIPLLIVRSTLVYGYGDTHNSYGPNRFIKELIQTNKITLFGKGDDVRSHILIDDLVSLIHMCAVHKEEGIINAATSPSYPFIDIANRIIREFGYGEIVYKPGANQVTYRHFNVHKLDSKFASLSFTKIEDGLKKTISLMNNDHVGISIAS